MIAPTPFSSDRQPMPPRHDLKATAARRDATRRCMGAEAQWRTATPIETTRAAARMQLITRARCGSRRSGARDAAAISHAVMITTIITLRTAILAAASAFAASARRALAKTAAIATQAFGLATPSNAPPASDGALVAAVSVESGGAVAMRYASQRM